MTARELLRALGRRWGLLLACIILSIAAGVGLMLAIGTSYVAEAEVLLVQPQPGATAEDTLLTQQKLNLLAFSYAEIVESGRFTELALDDAGVARRGASISGDTVKNTSTVTIRARADTAAAASEVADALATTLIDELDRPTLDLPSSDELDGIELERPDAERSDGGRLFAFVAAVVAGLALSITAVLLLEAP